MSADEVRAAREANPFRPFTIHLANGRSFRVHHRDYLSMSPNGRTIIVYQTDGEMNIMDLRLVTELAIEAPGSAATESADGNS